MKHKHADLIHAWADGAKVQFKSRLTGDWSNFDNDSFPGWFENYEYRIKPEEKKPVVRWLWADERGYVSAKMYTEDEKRSDVYDYKIKLEWSRTEFPK